ncbi:MAG: hypothetical protein CMM37_02330 [Rhodospirillaceae bacterium]|nr:hypothetical protein [Rhodospirillaceae bacterium]
MKLSINHYICSEEIAFSDFIQIVSDAGIPSIGVTCSAIEEMGIDNLKSCISDYGLSVSSLNSAGYFTHSSKRPNRYTDQELIEFSAMLNADILCVITGGLNLQTQSLSETHECVSKKIGELADNAERYGVTVGLEPINPKDIFSKGCINTISHALEIIRPYKNAKLILDFYHSWWDKGLLDIINDNAQHIGLIQICNIGLDKNKNLERRTIKDGIIDFQNFIPEILTSNYNQKIELEIFCEHLKTKNTKEVINEFSLYMKNFLI